MNNRLNTSFPFTYFPDKDEEVDYPNISFNNNFIRFFEELEPIEEHNNTLPEANFNYCQSKKKNGLEDISYSIEQAFCENSHMNIEEEFRPNQEDNYIKIGNEGSGIDPIQQELNSFEQGQNDSFYHENNYLIQDLGTIGNLTSSFENPNVNMTMPSEILRIDSTLDDSLVQKMKQTFKNIKLSKSITNNVNPNTNKSAMNIGKQLFTISNNSLNFPINNQEVLNGSNKLNNSSCNISAINSHNSKPKRGRRRFLWNGIKTEIIDKAYIREFKKYLKVKSNTYQAYFEEDKLFWNEFFKNTTPPFVFTKPNGEKAEFKSFSKQFLHLMFAKESVRKLYSIFIKEKEKELLRCIISKKVSKCDANTLLFYKIYGQNLHKFYSEEYSVNDCYFDEIEENFADSVNLSL